MKKKKTPSFILELPLKTTPKEEKELLSRFESARHLYNAVLGEAKKRVTLVKQSKLFQTARSLPKGKKNAKKRQEAFKSATDAYDFNEYSLHKYVGELRHNLVNNIDIQTAQKLGTRAFKAVSKIMYGTARKVRFKGYNQMNSVESKSNAAGIRWRDNQVKWNGLCLKPIIYTEDEVVRHGLKHKVKYCRIVRKVIRSRNRFYVQLVLKGKPFIKAKNQMGKGKVCFDFGPSTLAITAQKPTGEFAARLLQFCAELEARAKEIRNLQQKIDRQRRQGNPNNYLPNGKIKKGRLQWKKSKRMLENQKKLKEIQRAVAGHRKSLQGRTINEVIRMGDVFMTEDVSCKWLQSLFGKSVNTRSPGQFVSGVKRKAESAGGLFLKFPTQPTKLSQVCFCGRRHKKKLSDRVHDCECGVVAQRDLFSSYLGLFVEKKIVKKEEKWFLQESLAEKYWPSADTLLQVAWMNAVQSAKGRHCPSSFGKPPCQSQSGSLEKEEIAKFEVRDVVPAFGKQGESEREQSVFL